MLKKGSVLRMFRLVNPLEKSEAWKEDLNFLANRMQQIHPDLFFALSEQNFNEAVKAIELKIPTLSDEQIIVEFIKLVALPGVTGGRDGHSYIPLFQKATGFHALPLRLYQFSDGLFVIGAQKPYKELISKRLVQIGDLSIDEASALLNPLVSRDNDMTVKARLSNFLLVPELLHATGIVSSADTVSLVLESSNNKTLTISVEPISGKTYESWEETWQRSENFLADYLEESQTLLIQYNAVRAKTASGESLKAFSKHLDALVVKNGTKRIIVDIRENGGGNNFTYRPFLRFLTDSEAVNQSDNLFIITGRNTFSAAGNFVTELEQRTNALFVGEPMGGGVNQYGDNRLITLPNSHLEARVASKYWQISTADDKRLTITPDIPVDVSSKDFFAKRDPVLEVILAYQ